jgi:hypothetical protein
MTSDGPCWAGSPGIWHWHCCTKIEIAASTYESAERKHEESLKTPSQSRITFSADAGNRIVGLCLSHFMPTPPVHSQRALKFPAAWHASTSDDAPVSRQRGPTTPGSGLAIHSALKRRLPQVPHEPTPYPTITLVTSEKALYNNMRLSFPSSRSPLAAFPNSYVIQNGNQEQTYWSSSGDCTHNCKFGCSSLVWLRSGCH